LPDAIDQALAVEEAAALLKERTLVFLKGVG
jgi:hypothetical protein